MTTTLADFPAIYTEHYPAAVTLARRLGARDPENVAAEAFASVLDAATSGRRIDNFRAYTMAAVRHEAQRQGRKDTRCRPTDDPRAFDTDAVYGPTPDTGDLALAAFRSLSDSHRWVLQLIELEGLTPRDIAARTSMSANAVAALAYRARVALRAAYAAQIERENA